MVPEDAVVADFSSETGIWDGAFLSIFSDCQGFEAQLQMWALSNS